MPDYIHHALEKLQYVLKIYLQYSPHNYINTNWTKKSEQPYTREEDTSALLPPNRIKYIQQVVGTFLYYLLALNCTMLTALNDIGAQQLLPTKKVQKEIQHLLDYAST